MASHAQQHAVWPSPWRWRASCSACHELLCSRAFLFIVLRSAQHLQIPRFLQIFRGIWPMPLSHLNHSALALFAQRTRIPTSARSIGFCAIWVCISSSSMQTTTCKRAACGLAVPPYQRAKPIYLPSNATDASRGRPPAFFETPSNSN